MQQYEVQVFTPIVLFESGQRYKFESNSQHLSVLCVVSISCLNQVKDTSLKAIHNCLSSCISSRSAVWIRSKIQVWKQFTTACHTGLAVLGLFESGQRYKFESNSQQRNAHTAFGLAVWIRSKIQVWKQFTTIYAVMLSLRCCLNQVKDTSLKAIHNYSAHSSQFRQAVWIRSKIQVWKQFTTFLPQRWDIICCLNQVKDTSLKAIHNNQS